MVILNSPAKGAINVNVFMSHIHVLLFLQPCTVDVLNCQIKKKLIMPMMARIFIAFY